MPLTPEELDALARNPQSATGDQGSYTEFSADDLLKLNAAAGAADAVEGTNLNGGSKSAFNCLRPARAAFPGAFR